MPNRILKESAFTSDRIALLSDFEFRLWAGLITQADDAGRGDARPAIIKGRVFALRERTTIKDIESALRALAAAGCVSLYTVGGKPYFQFPNWAAHQRVRDAKPKYPAPEDGEMTSCGELPQSAASCGELPPESNPIQSESKSEAETKDLTVSDDTVRRADVRRVVEAWNSLGLSQVEKITADTERGKLLKKRLKDYGVDKVLAAVGMVKSSAYLQGQNDKGWTITFDWFVKPNNFVKVLSGNYADREPKGGSHAGAGSAAAPNAAGDRGGGQKYNFTGRDLG